MKYKNMFFVAILATSCTAIATPSISQDEKAKPPSAGAATFPSGLIAFFDRDKCPDGWDNMEVLWGRYLVGVYPAEKGGVRGQAVGSQLSPQENRATGAHRHAVNVYDHGFNQGEPQRRMQFKDNGGGHFVVRQEDTIGVGKDLGEKELVQGTNAPYVGFLACKKQ